MNREPLTHKLLVVVVSTVLVTCFAIVGTAQTPPAAQPQVPPAAQRAIREAIDLMEKGLTEQAAVSLKVAAERAQEADDKRSAAFITQTLGRIYRELGNTDKFINTMFQAYLLALGTDLEVPFEAAYRLGVARTSVDDGLLPDPIMDLLGALFYLSLVNESLPKISAEEMRMSTQSEELTVRIYFYLKLASARLEELSSEDLAPSLQVLLFSALQRVPPQKVAPELPQSIFPKVKPLVTALTTQQAAWLNQRRPWKRALLEIALDLNQQVIEVDRKRNPKIAELELAKDLSQRGDIYRHLGDLNRAIEAKKQALAVFDQHDLFEDAVIVLDGLCQLYLAQRSDTGKAEAFRVSDQLIFRIERQMLGLVGQSVPDFFAKHGHIYHRTFSLLLDEYLEAAEKNHPQAGRVLEKFLLMADRLNFRPVRRDLAVYRELGDQFGSQPENSQPENRRRFDENRQRFEKQKQAIAKLRQYRERAKAEGKVPADFRVGDIAVVDSPFLSLELAHQDLVSTLEDFKRLQVGSTVLAVSLPSSLADVCRGMTPADGIVMYIQSPVTEEILAAVLTANQPPRLVRLPDVTPKSLAALVNQAHDQFDIESPETQQTLKQIAVLLWHPLSSLPENLTIVLTPGLIGIPFESLPTTTGEPVIAHHNVRYAFGLANGLGVFSKMTEYRRAMIAGAASFIDLPALQSSKDEIEILRARLQNLMIAPATALPSAGQPIFQQRAEFDFIHLSTHSRLEKVPMADSLAFPTDDLFAYDLAISPVRAKLLVLSACELFRQRQDSFNPVSGITTAMMARIAPQVISTLWPVNSAATQVFMLRFYDALLAEREPAAALAVTKRDFLNPERLEAWLKSAGLPIPLGIRSYNEPYYWAPFVLTIGITETGK